MALHPDTVTKNLITTDLGLFVIIVSILIFYYRLVDSGFSHNESVMYSGLIGLVIATIVASILYTKYIHNHREEHIDEHIS